MFVEVLTVELLRVLGRDLFEGHGDEATPDLPVEINWAVYSAIEAAGKLLILGLFTDEDQLVGYSVNVTDTLLNSAGVSVCQNTALYVEPEARSKGGGLKLMRTTARCAREMGLQRMQITAPASGTLGQVLTGLGYKQAGVVYKKEF